MISSSLILKGFLVWILIAGAEVLHGILRSRFLAPKVGDLRSRQMGVFSGCLVIFSITWLTFDWIEIQSDSQAIWIGLLWLVLMVTFEFTLGHFVFRFSWRWLLNEFNLFKGRLLLLGMLFLALAPLLVRRMN